jgi:NAD(P)-dependent dehydrogenase (short-subunit alcohol dehydrogenase family)
VTTLQGLSVLVTGAGNGIGEAIAVAMGAAGASVAVADLDLSAAERTSDAINEGGQRAFAIEADCGEVVSIVTMIGRTVEAFGRLDVLVNNAGVTRHADDILMDVTEDDWDRIHRVNARGVFFCLQHAARVMIAQGSGRIINIASIAGRGYPGTSNAAYAASKGAVIALTKTAAQQLGKRNINVNAICPGFTVTRQTLRLLGGRAAQRGTTVEEMLAVTEQTIPLRRSNTPEDIAAMAVFLASPGARNITGQAYNVDGGLVTS